jgi:(p)ppGpp synthase/HD superfamily hydrolase
MYAQTNLQLFNQLQLEGYLIADLDLIQDAYGLAMELFTGIYRLSGKTFIAHLVGTASVLAGLGASAKLIAAGLLHAAYVFGDFGESGKGISPLRREQMRKAVGQEVEEYVARYTAFMWEPKDIRALDERFHELGPVERDLVLMRLANQVDELLDLGVLYCFAAEKRRQHYVDLGPVTVGLAEKLGFPTLAAELTRVVHETASAKIPAEFRRRYTNEILIAPKSYCRRPAIVFRQKLSRALDILHRSLGFLANELKRLSWQVVEFTSLTRIRLGITRANLERLKIFLTR